MKLYKITSPAHVIPEKDDVASLTIEAGTAWEGTQADARKVRIAFEQPFKEIKPAKRPKVEVEEVDVPTDKNGLLDWLNKNAV